MQPTEEIIATTTGDSTNDYLALGTMILPLALVLLVATGTDGFLSIFRGQKVVKELDIDKYLGTWYEAYGSFIQKKTFQQNGVCTTATYSFLDDKKTIKVVNAANRDSPDGERFSVEGTAVSESVGKFIVQFPQAPKQSKANYFVLKLGPVSNNKYDYAIIGSPYRLFSWILVRDVKTFKEKYEKETVKFLKKSGYWLPWNKPRETYQGDKCTYKS